jgi:hypothetical protein
VKWTGAVLRPEPFLRFVLSWETDASEVALDVDMVRDRSSAPGGAAESATTMTSYSGTAGYGPSVFNIVRPPSGQAYRIQARYPRRGAMGHAIGRVLIIEHDGNGKLRFDDRPFVIMNEGGGTDLGVVVAPPTPTAPTAPTAPQK